MTINLILSMDVSIHYLSMYFLHPALMVIKHFVNVLTKTSSYVSELSGWKTADSELL